MDLTNDKTDETDKTPCEGSLMLIDTTHLKASADLAALVASDLGPPAKRHGRWLLWCCPFHDDHEPSFGVTADNGRWHCFGCGKSGDAITWLMEREGLTFREACKRLGALTGLPLAPAPQQKRNRSAG